MSNNSETDKFVKDCLLDAALHYADIGLSVVPLNGKEPASIWVGGEQQPMSWRRYQHERASLHDIYHWNAQGLLKNVGLVCGGVSGNLVVLDLDGLPAVDVYERAFSNLLDTFSVLTGSGQGMHLYYRVTDLPPTTRAIAISDVGNLEMRSAGCYVVAPPSIHPDTQQPYLVERALPILEVPNLDAVRTWIRSLLSPKEQSVVPTSLPTKKDQRAIRFAEAALSSEICTVRLAVTGNRNNQLNRAAYSLGQLVADSLLSHDKVEAALLSAALDAGLSEAEAWRTIKSGLSAGIRNPRSRRYGR